MPTPCADPRVVTDTDLGPVRRVVVLRALMLGDMLCAVPALRALRRRFPEAHIALVGLPWAREWIARLGCVDEFIAFPGHPGLPEQAPQDEAARAAFGDAMRSRSWDLAVQLHGSGRLTNAVVSDWGARHVAAFHEPGCAPPEPLLSVPWPAQGSEATRLARLIGVFGGTEVDEHLAENVFPLRASDREAARALLQQHGAAPGRPWICLHAGAQWPSRRWPPARFAQVGRALAAVHDVTLVLTGVASESSVVAAVEAALQGLGSARCINLVGQTPLWTVGALIEGASLLVSNDTGVSHIAAALGTPSVVVSCGAEVARWTPGRPELHRVLWADVPCRPCMHARCPTAHECAMAVWPMDVVDHALSLLDETSRPEDPHPAAHPRLRPHFPHEQEPAWPRLPPDPFL